MRTDDGTDRSTFRKSDEWTHNAITGESSAETDQRMVVGDEIAQGNMVVHSLSGKERNHLFMNQNAGESFSNDSAISGLDSVADGRGFAYLDYDRDGFQDVALVNANSPLVQLYHNDIPELQSSPQGMIALRFVGGNTSAAPSKLSNRDGFGAMVSITLKNGKHLKREHLCGQGFATQSSSTMIIGIGEASQVASIGIRWPSGKTTETENIPEGTLLTAFENQPAESFTRETYRAGVESKLPVSQKFQFPIAKNTPGKLQVFTSMATWCPSCRKHLPSLAFLETEDIALFGVPIDQSDTTEMLEEYISENAPAYDLLSTLGAAERDSVSAFLAKAMQTDNLPLPSSIITDSEGRILEVMTGIPTLSQVRRWMSEAK